MTTTAGTAAFTEIPVLSYARWQGSAADRNPFSDELAAAAQAVSFRTLADHPHDWSGWQVVSNLPYSVGSPILVELAQAAQPPRSITVTLQAEVVDRIRAAPDTSDYGVLTLLLARVYRFAGAFRIPSSCFFPAPDVESACLRLEQRPVPLAEGAAATTYPQLVKLAFSQRRKRARKVLRSRWSEEALAHAWSRLGLDDNLRPETLSPETFAELARHLAPVAG